MKEVLAITLKDGLTPARFLPAEFCHNNPNAIADLDKIGAAWGQPILFMQRLPALKPEDLPRPH